MIKINLKLFFCFFVQFVILFYYSFAFFHSIFIVYFILIIFLLRFFAEKELNFIYYIYYKIVVRFFIFIFPLFFQFFCFSFLHIKCSNITKIMFHLLFLNISDSHFHPWFLIGHQSLLPLMHFFHLYSFFINNSLLWYRTDIILLCNFLEANYSLRSVKDLKFLFILVIPLLKILKSYNFFWFDLIKNNNKNI